MSTIGWSRCAALLVSSFAMASAFAGAPGFGARSGGLSPVASLAPVAQSTSSFSFDVSGIESFGAFGNPANTVVNLLLAPNAEIVGVSWDVNVTAHDPSWLSELVLDFSDSALTAGVSFSPGFADDAPGTASYSGSANLTDLALNFNVGADGILRLEFWEGFDDAAVDPDGIWNSGTITFEVIAVPEPEINAMLLAGLGVLGMVARRRRQR